MYTLFPNQYYYYILCQCLKFCSDATQLTVNIKISLLQFTLILPLQYFGPFHNTRFETCSVFQYKKTTILVQ